ncbi:MAG: archaemetzincin family Zn-dependent metalloprotease [Aquificota bacterium]|nr:archaemetzincin family Zn-dependent metalloprotease [Aquificota bacterium]
MFVYIVFFGGIEERLILAVSGNVRRTFRLGVRVSSVPFPPKLGYNPYRDQYHAGTILRYMAGLDFPGLVKMLAVVSFDLYEEGLNFVFGEADLGGRNAVVSIFRLKHGDEKVFFERVFKEVNHELGHCFGLTHCEDPSCVMSFSSSVVEVDRKGKDFCETCRESLGRALRPFLEGPHQHPQKPE